MSDSTETTNLPWYARILVHYQHLTLALLIGVCFGLAVSLIALDSSRDSVSAALTAEHASDIARLGADQSSQPLFNNDLISLQVLLTSLVQLDQVQGLTVHDVENRLLAQAGNVAAAGGIYRTALITQNDNVAGYLTVIAHRPSNTSSRNLWFAVFALAMGVLMLLLLKRQLPFLNDTPEADDIEDDEDSELEFALNQHGPGDNCIALTLVSERIQQVAKQLNAATFNRVLDELNRHINSVKTLYGAQLVTAGHSLPVLLFDGKDREQNTINALCSAQLLLALSYRMKTPLALHAQVEEYQRDGKLTDCPERFQSSSKTLFLGIAAPLAEPLQDRFRFREDTGYWLETEEFGESYQSLLDNQLKQLLRTSGYDIDLDDGSSYRQAEQPLESATEEPFASGPDSELLPATRITTEHPSDQTGLDDDDLLDDWQSDPTQPQLGDSESVITGTDTDFDQPRVELSPDPSLTYTSDASEDFGTNYDDLDEINKLEDNIDPWQEPEPEPDQPTGFVLNRNEDTELEAPTLHDTWHRPENPEDDDMQFTPAPDSELSSEDLEFSQDGLASQDEYQDEALEPAPELTDGNTTGQPWPSSSLFEKPEQRNPGADDDDQTEDNTPPAKGEHIKPYRS